MTNCNIDTIFFDVGATLRYVVEDKAFAANAEKELMELVGTTEDHDAFFAKLEANWKAYRKQAKSILLDCSEMELWLHYMLPDYPAERIVSYEGVRILMLHGHTRNVKHGTETLEAYARGQGIDLVLYGHTHRAEDRYLPPENGEGKPLRLFNPGSIGASYGEGPRFGYLDLRNGQVVSNGAVYEEL